MAYTNNCTLRNISKHLGTLKHLECLVTYFYKMYGCFYLPYSIKCMDAFIFHTSIKCMDAFIFIFLSSIKCMDAWPTKIHGLLFCISHQKIVDQSKKTYLSLIKISVALFSDVISHKEREMTGKLKCLEYKLIFICSMCKITSYYSYCFCIG